MVIKKATSGYKKDTSGQDTGYQNMQPVALKGLLTTQVWYYRLLVGNIALPPLPTQKDLEKIILTGIRFLHFPHLREMFCKNKSGEQELNLSRS